jgi:hypothetical protein
VRKLGGNIEVGRGKDRRWNGECGRRKAERKRLERLKAWKLGNWEDEKVGRSNPIQLN